MIDKDKILEQVKVLLDIADNTKDPKLQIYMEMAEESILDFTNRTELLDSMGGILRDYTIALYQQGLTIGGSTTTTGVVTGAVKRVTEGEQTIEYETGTGTTSTSSGTTLSTIPVGIMDRLLRYRKNKVCLFD